MTQSRFHHLGVQSHYFLSWVFRIVGLQISLWHSEPQFSFISVQSHSFYQFQSFRAVSSFWHSESLSSLTFNVIFFLQFWRSELSCILIQAPRVIIFPPFDIQSHFPPALSFERAHFILGQIWRSFLFFGKVHFVSFVYILTLLVNSTEEGHICRPQNLSQFYFLY